MAIPYGDTAVERRRLVDRFADVAVEGPAARRVDDTSSSRRAAPSDARTDAADDVHLGIVAGVEDGSLHARLGGEVEDDVGATPLDQLDDGALTDVDLVEGELTDRGCARCGEVGEGARERSSMTSTA